MMVGLIQVYTGDGKGKTTAALGLALRAAGSGMKVLIIQFMKKWDYGELHSLKLIPHITLETFGTKEFIYKGKAKKIDYEEAEKAFSFGVEGLQSGNYDLVIFDELNLALYYELLDLKEVIKKIKEKPEKVEVVITGRKAPQEIIEIADLVTEMREVKHPYQKGVEARKGIEF
ncbi:MAG: cob(I)yrinic acid a,c-diamide adenosyltransferase [Candidatus Infernicultor aquiphilus]|uniref:corrinoid adenosyltransferase n=2 Tax=Candidatus Infernicultor aquiphilus TaxID=1805029 RepID=A0A2M7PPG5_9BACT|nr:cob(I)yrinic acid a,c-diamide adenosyltransferase [bacterium]PIU24825.1 MAG: cob(I)yrinic acid a,c-diamide adenosyltransferase [Candidatus Atribacteria bacterium CG08_land_8_20_14_0_20_33_29]PIX33628.1 MAG: cob(I)yrinic acid a,c-diamide adenosyltransferase [Candidatus Atribacteria bacterium CG_4_8_14_3_um_filter_34_18]PIY32509.1 MAG: cob(I)yrinic acid a,c-diamide adenosyltransferase [Candidatus Atribacteria bacterium CG_4_10_14_3_um_filter_34_13]PJB58102.1 MAG: cob(I)yrinic acid a,c-diamide 